MTEANKPKSPFENSFLFRFDARYRVCFSLVVGIISYFLFGHQSLPATALTVWICFAATLIILNWIIMFWAHPRHIKAIAGLEDSGRTVIFIIAIAASLISLVAIYLLLKSTQNKADEEISASVFLAMTAVITSWLLVHTIFTLRYAHMYYGNAAKNEKMISSKRGLEFPGQAAPDYIDFAYFAFVIGMTFQVSDVEISSRQIRRLALLHSLISFAFNTAIVALSINIISSLVSK
jgi:uncharacterized membrane protein